MRYRMRSAFMNTHFYKHSYTRSHIHIRIEREKKHIHKQSTWNGQRIIWYPSIQMDSRVFWDFTKRSFKCIPLTVRRSMLMLVLESFFDALYIFKLKIFADAKCERSVGMEWEQERGDTTWSKKNDVCSTHKCVCVCVHVCVCEGLEWILAYCMWLTNVYVP